MQWLSLVVGLMQTAQREVQNVGRGHAASVRLDGSEIGSLHNKHSYAGGEHCDCGDRHKRPCQA